MSDLGNSAKLQQRSHTYAATGAVYSGTWLGGMRHGSGTMKWSDGAMYEGNWYCNQTSKSGKFSYPNGDVY